MIELENFINSDTFQEVCDKIDRELLSFSFLASGGHNDHYLLKTKYKGVPEKLVLRVRATDQFQNIYKEYNNLKSLDGRFGPRCYHIDTDCKILPRPYLLLEYVDGPIYNNQDNYISRDLLLSIANYYHELHSIKGPIEKELSKNGHYSIEKSFKYHFKNRFNSSKHVLPNAICKNIVRSIEIIDFLEEELSQILKTTKVASLVHGDPTVGNIVFLPQHNSYKSNQVILLDWEFSRYDLVEFDLTFFLDSYEISDDDCDLFLKEYSYFSKGGDQKILYGVWLCHLMRIIAWRVERIHLVKNGFIKGNRHATDEITSLKRIERYLRRIELILEKYEHQDLKG